MSTGQAPETPAVILAAGGARRFRGATHKLLATVPARDGTGSQAVIERAVRAALDAAIGPVIVVTGAVDVTTAIKGLDQCGELEIEVNPRWAEGQATSLTAGVEAARRRRAKAIVVGLGDQPGVEPSAWRSVAAGRNPITVATYGGRRGNPVRLADEIWPLLPTEGDTGARTLMSVRPDLVGEVACEGSTVDIDTLEDLERWQNS